MADWTEERRHALPKEDFGDPEHEKYPVETQKDLEDACRLVGKAPDENQAGIRRRLRAIAKRKGFTLPESWSEQKETSRVPDSSSARRPVTVPVADTFLFSAREAEGGAGAGDGGPGKVMLLAAGMSRNNVVYPRTVLEAQAAWFSPIKVFDNHQSDAEERTKPYRSIREHIATIKETFYDPTPREKAPEGGVVGTLYPHVAWFKERLAEAPETVEFSIRCGGLAKHEQRNGRSVTVMESFVRKGSCDAVTDAGAGGHVISVREWAHEEQEMVQSMVLGDLTPEQLKEQAPALYQQIAESHVVNHDYGQTDEHRSWKRSMARAKRDGDQEGHDKLLDRMPYGASHERDECHMCRADMRGKPAESKESDMPASTDQQEIVQLREAVQKLTSKLEQQEQQQRLSQALDSKLAVSGLPKQAQDFLRVELRETGADDARIDATIERLKKVVGGPEVRGMGQQGTPTDVKESVSKRLDVMLDQASPKSGRAAGVIDARTEQPEPQPRRGAA